MVFFKFFAYHLSLNAHQCGSKSVFAEGSILYGALLVSVFEFLQDILAQDTFALAVNEHDALAFLLQVLIHDFSEFLHLSHQDISAGQAIGIVKQFLSMQVHHQFLWLCIGLGGFGLALRGFLFLGRSCAQQGFLDLLSIGKGCSYGLVVPHYAYRPAGISEEFIGLERM